MYKFNIVFYGHEHEHDGSYILDLQNRDILSLHGTAIYHKDRQDNGYCIYTYDIDNLQIKIKESIFDDKQKTFNNIVDKCINDIDLTSKSNKAIRNQTICSTMIPKIKEKINQYLTINLTSETNQRDIEEIFINQKMVDFDNSHVREKVDYKDKRSYSIDEIILLKQNILISGGTESGKTTTLNMINLKILSEYNELIPIFLFSRELVQETTERALISKIGDFLDKYYGKNNFKLKHMLDNKGFVFLIDDINLLNDAFIKVILSSENRVIATVSYDNNYIVERDRLDIFSIRDSIFNEFKKIELKALRKKECSLLVKNIVPEELSQKIANKVQNSLSTLNLPSNPFIATLLTWMHLQKIDIRDSEPELIDIFLDFLLEKTDLSKKFNGKIDFNDKKDLLSTIAFKYFNEKSFAIKENDILKVIIDHFEYTGTEVRASDVLDYFYKKRVLIKNNGSVVFSYRVFYYYFISLYMKNNSNFRNTVMKSKVLISNMMHELRYYSAMSRNDKEFIDNILCFLSSNKIQKKKNFIEEDNQKLLIGQEEKEYQETEINIPEEEIILSQEEVEFCDRLDEELSEIRNNEVQEYNYEIQENKELDDLKKYREEFFALNIIASEFIKHLGSSISFEEKNKYIEQTLQNYSYVMEYWKSVFGNKKLVKKFLNIYFKEEMEKLSETKINEMIKEAKLDLTYITAEIVKGSLSTPKLIKTYKTNIGKTNKTNIYFFYCLLINEVDTNNFFKYIDMFIEINNDKLLFFILERVIIHNYVTSNYTAEVKKEMYTLLLKLEVAIHVNKSAIKDKKEFQKYIPKVKEKRPLNISCQNNSDKRNPIAPV